MSGWCSSMSWHWSWSSRPSRIEACRCLLEGSLQVPFMFNRHSLPMSYEYCGTVQTIWSAINNIGREYRVCTGKQIKGALLGLPVLDFLNRLNKRASCKLAPGNLYFNSERPAQTTLARHAIRTSVLEPHVTLASPRILVLRCTATPKRVTAPP